MSTILVGVDDTDRSKDAVALARALALVTRARVVLANVFRYEAVPSRAAVGGMLRTVLEQDARQLLATMRHGLEDLDPARVEMRAYGCRSVAHGLHDLAVDERADLIVVGSSHVGHIGRVMPGSTGERLLHGSPCAVAIAPSGYRAHREGVLRRVGVAWNGSTESATALAAASAMTMAFGGELEVIDALAPTYYGSPALMTGPGYVPVLEDYAPAEHERVDRLVAGLPAGLRARASFEAANAVDVFASHSEQLDVLVCGSRGYGPLRAVLVGGFVGRLARRAACPLIVVPRGVAEPLGSLFDGKAAVTAS